MWEYYRDNKANLPKWIVEFREDILEDLIQGTRPTSAFTTIVGNVD